MPTCSVIVCKNRSDHKLEGVTFHRFPNEKIFKEKWINSTGRGPDWWPTKQSTICSVHFEKKHFKPHTKNRRLFEWAVPTLKLRLVFATADTNDTSRNLQISPARIAKDSEPQIVYEPGIDETPRKKRLQLELEKYKNVVKGQKKTINRLQVKTSRYKKKIIQLTGLIKELQQKNLVNSDQADHLQVLGDGVNDLSKRFAEKNATGSTGGQ